MIEENVLKPDGGGSRRGFAHWRDARVAGFVARRLSGVTKGRLQLTLPSGRLVVLGSGGGVEAELRLSSYALAWRALRRGTLGFAESYIDGTADSPDIGAVLRFFLVNYAAFEGAGRGWFRARMPDRLAHRARRNSRAGSRRNIAAHYDLGNAFYELWLDPGMTYSSGIYQGSATSLAAAQAAKNAAILAALSPLDGKRVLEIGCGWGGLSEELARAGADVAAITVSREQHAYAQARIAAEGLADRVDVRFEDYRDVTGAFDHIASVEMIEAVGEEHWPVYFQTLADRLVPGGSAVIQAITIREESFAAYQRHPDFIQRYIFPGGMLPTVSIMRAQAQAAGMEFEPISQFGLSYARTLRDWRARFDEAWPRINALGFDERFRRMWMYYFIYCEVGFETGITDVGHYKLTRRRP
ncbi:MAG: cyclopropane-fatty-acyl-phospholipid synthase family protein [Hyphomicrobiaceae bacterium]|nr:cyclopropane-fatty-acyl-phospholipid synthase family protein [Hyphomicrobiaceae bacterium]